MKEETSSGFLLNRRKLPDGTHSEKKESISWLMLWAVLGGFFCCFGGFLLVLRFVWFCFVLFSWGFCFPLALVFLFRMEDKVVDADLLCVWGIFDHSTQSEKDAVRMKGYRLWLDQGCARGHFYHSHIFAAFSVSLTDTLPVTWDSSLSHWFKTCWIWCLAER